MEINENVLKEINDAERKGKLILTLSNSDLYEIPENIFNLEKLRHLSLSSNHLESISHKISLIYFLRWLDLSANKFKEIPIELFDLQYLQILALNNNNISYIPSEITKLHHLKTLDLENNNIKVVPKELIFLPNLISLNLKGNPIQIPPVEIVEQGIKAIRNYYLELEGEETDYLHELKLLFVGEGRVGKTSLANSLILNDYLLDNEKTTEGIDIKKWVIQKEKLNSKKNFRVNIWDFGGQEIYHDIHHFFLTRRSIYLLVTETRKEDKHEDFYYWLNIIKTLGDNSPIIIVLNKCDLPTKEIPIEQYKSIFKNIVSLEKVSCKPKHKDRIETLKKTIYRIISDQKYMPHIGTPLPKAWVEIRKELEKLNHEGEISITLNDYLEICRKYNRNEKSALYLSRFFHDLGVFLHFQDDIDLRDTIFLNHKWVTDAFYKILDNEKVKSNFGIFTSSDILNIWKGNNYNGKRRDLLALLKNKKFEICYKINENKYLAPKLLKVDKIAFDWVRDSDDIIIEYQYKFMPKGILPRFIVKRNQDIFENKCWRYGVILEYEKTKALVVENYFERKLIIKIAGENKKKFLTIIRKTIQEIHSSFSNLKLTEYIQCICPKCKTSIKSSFFSVENLFFRMDKGKATIECYESFDDINVIFLLMETGYHEIANSKDGVEVKTIYDDPAIIKIEDAIKNNEIKKALNLLYKFVKRNGYRNKENQIILLQSQWKNLKDYNISGTLSSSEANQQKNIIKSNILDLIYNE